MFESASNTRYAAALAAALLLTAPAGAAEGDEARVGAEELAAVEPWVTTIDLRDLPALEWRPGDPIKVIPRRIHPKPPRAGLTPPPPAQGPDVLAVPQPAAPGGGRFATTASSFEGQGFSGVYPADPVGEAGPQYYVQMLNGSAGTGTTFYDKVDGTPIASFALEELAPPGSACANGLGDPIALYDHLAGRWFLSEFANDPPNALCLYVSRNGDPISGGWYHYQIDTASFPDYPKYAVWPDAYFVNTNEDDLTVYALDRQNMLQGLPLRPTQKFVAPALSFWFFQTLPPVDLDGPPPPAGAPGLFVRQRDTELHNPGSPSPLQDFVDLWPFHVDWDNPANSTFGPRIAVPVADFNSLLCDPVTFSCIPQPAGRPLDPLREAVMWKPQYRNFGTHESVVGNFAVALDAPNHAGVRWFELRRTGSGPWTLYQEGTWAGPLGQADPTNRWMAGSGMDKNGNIGLAYDVSSAAVFPGIRYTGRLATDAPGTMSQGDVTLIEGTGPSLPFERWGDYNSLNVDAENDCVFWFTSMYGRKDCPTCNPLGDWATRIGSFSFEDCVVEASNRPPVARNDEASTTPGSPVSLDLLADNGNGADFDPDGDPLLVIAVGEALDGTVTDHGEGLVTYAPDPGFTGDDGFSYEISDGRGGTAVGEVTIEVGCPTLPRPAFSDDFEPAPDSGWEVETVANGNPVSLTWTAAPDPFAQSPSTSFVSDATTLDTKDDRLISPPVDLSPNSRLSFWHRFDFEGGFDGGVLEVSTDGGATWVDVIAGGGEFVQGGYNGAISNEYGSPIAGRAAWTGSSGDPDVMVRVEIDVSAFAGSGVRVRWRLGADPLAPGALPGVGWWVDDVEFLDLIEDCQFPPRAEDDHAATSVDTPVAVDVLANDSDPDGDPLAVVGWTSPAHGDVEDGGDGVLIYTPAPGYSGDDSFDYTIADGRGGEDSATVFVTVEEEPQPATKVTGGGWVALPSGKANFGFNAHGEAAPPQGRITCDVGDGETIRGTVAETSLLSMTRASFSGPCELEDGSACSYRATVEDNGEPGAGNDRFAIEVFDAAGRPIRAIDELLGGGNIQIH